MWTQEHDKVHVYIRYIVINLLHVKEESKLEIFSRLYPCTCRKENGLSQVTWNVSPMHRNVRIKDIPIINVSSRKFYQDTPEHVLGGFKFILLISKIYY